MRFFKISLMVVALLSQGGALAGWAKFYGDNVQFTDFEIADDGSLIVLGELAESDGEFNARQCLAWVAKLDTTGEVRWQKCYDQEFEYRSDFFNSVLPTGDGGILLVGVIKKEVSEEPSLGGGGRLVKLDAQGIMQWHKSYQFAFPSVERASLQAAVATQTGFILIGKIEPESGPDKAWILGLDREGRVLWHKTLAGFLAGSLHPTRDGNFIVAGATGLTGKGEAWVMKLDAGGKVLWQRSYGGGEELPGGSEDIFLASDVIETASGEYWLAGITLDTLSSAEGEFPEFRSRAWIAKLDREGHLQWRKLFSEELANIGKILPTPEGGLIAFGGIQNPEQKWKRLGWLAKLTDLGEILWQKQYGEGGGSLQLLANGRPLFAGASLLGTEGDWLLELEPDGTLPECGLAKEAAVSVREAALSERTLSYAENPPKLTVLERELFAGEDRGVTAVSACPVSQAFGSCGKILEAGRSYGSGFYPVALQTPQGPELLGTRCEMQAYGGGWMLIARQVLSDPRPPTEFVSQRFGKYGSESESFSIWPVVDWSATLRVVGLSWTEGPGLSGGARLLSDLSPQELQAILRQSPQVNAWVR
jgi:hypothetical protein